MSDLTEILDSISHDEWGNLISPRLLAVLAAATLAVADLGLLWLVSATWA
jgi:hypothetical protein